MRDGAVTGPKFTRAQMSEAGDWRECTTAGSDTSKSYTKVLRPCLQMCA